MWAVIFNGLITVLSVAAYTCGHSWASATAAAVGFLSFLLCLAMWCVYEVKNALRN